jgi:16S rRNA processing protein RimM
LTDTKILIAQITAPQGLDGSVRLKSFADSPENLKRYRVFQTTRGALTLKTLRVQPNATIAKFMEIADRTAAETWRGIELHVARSQLPKAPENEFYQSDLIGMAVVSSTGDTIGTVIAIPNYGAGDLIDIELHAGGTRLFPFADAAVHSVDNAARQIILHAEYLAE